MKKKLLYFTSLFSLFPTFAHAIAPLVIALIAGAVGIVGYMTYRSFVPTDITGAYNIFSSCWTCGLFSSIIDTLSVLINNSYTALGKFMIELMILATGIWIVYDITMSFIKSKVPVSSGWDYVNNYVPHLIKMLILAIILMFPLPRFMMSTFIEPIFSVGMSYGKLMDKQFSPEQYKNSYQTCLISTIVQDVQISETKNHTFSPKLRASLTCSIANIHRLTATGITMGWTLMNEAFSNDYAYHVAILPVFPNLGLLLSGITLIIMFLSVLLPIPIYMLEIFIELSMDFLFLPLILLGWLFNGKSIFIGDKKTIKAIIDKFIAGIAGIAVLLIFISFATFFLNALFSSTGTINAIETALQNNDPKLIVDGISFENSSFINLIFIGIFMMIFMFGMLKLVKQLFSGVSIPEKYLDITKENIKYMKGVTENIYKIFSNKSKK